MGSNQVFMPLVLILMYPGKIYGVSAHHNGPLLQAP